MTPHLNELSQKKNEANTPNQPLPSLAAAEAPIDLVEMAVVELSSDQCAPVASASSNIICGALQVSPSSQPASPMFHLANVPIDANVSPKTKCKIVGSQIYRCWYFIDL